MARIPGLDTALGTGAALLKAQADALAALPEVVAAFGAAVRGLGETVTQARETVAAASRLTARLESVVDELEQPLRDLAPGLARLAVVLDDPSVTELPETLRRVQADVLPVLKTISETHERVAGLAALPGAALFGMRRPPSAP